MKAVEWGKPPADIMSREEIIELLKELRTRGWSICALARAIGTHEDHGATLLGKIRGTSSIYRGEQRRFSRQLHRILSGELVPGRGHPQLADDPKPLRRPAKMVLIDGKLRWLQPRIVAGEPALPSFRKVFG